MGVRFWIVWSPQGVTPPKHVHLERHKARAVARRMAERYPRAEFFVMEADARYAGRVVVDADHYRV